MMLICGYLWCIFQSQNWKLEFRGGDVNCGGSLQSGRGGRGGSSSGPGETLTAPFDMSGCVE